MGNNDSLAIDAVGLTSFVVNYCAHIQNTMVQFSCCAFLGSSKTPSESMSGMAVGNLQMPSVGGPRILFTTSVWQDVLGSTTH